MKAKVLALDGKPVEEVDLPLQFEEEFRPDLIRRAFHAYRTQFLQPKGNYLLAGLQTSAEYYGRRHAWRQTINAGRSRLPREKVPGGRSGAVRIVPHAVKGRRAHPPKPWKILKEKINRKERSKAIRSAMNATLSSELVARRHRYAGPLPLVIAAPFEEIKRVKEAKKILELLGLKDDLVRAYDGRKIRSGRSRLRKGGYREPKSVLIVYANDKGVHKATRNIPGVEAVNVKDLNAELLAPGGQPGRLVLWTKGAIDALKNDQLFA